MIDTSRQQHRTLPVGARLDPVARVRGRLRTGALAFAVSATLITTAAAGQDLAAAGSGVSSGVGTAVLAGRWSTVAGSDGPRAGFSPGQDPWSSGQSGWGSGQNAAGSGFSGGISGGTGSTGTTSTGTAATSAESRGVVLINTVLPYDEAEGAGTGLVLTANGEVLTNYHVVEGASTIKVTLASTGATYTAKVVGSDAKDDVALLQLARASGLRTVTIDDDSTAVGDDVTAVGNAGGTGSLTAAAGTISSLSATITTAAEGSVASETLSSLIQTDADVVAGDSGGPLYDSEGEVIGIDTAASSGGEVDGYAIPINKALAVVARIRAGNATDGVRIGAAAFLGVEVADTSASDGSGQPSWGQQGWGQQSSGWNDTSGATVAGVVSGTAAAKAGLTVGDVITRVGGTTITTADQVGTLLAGENPGDRITIGWTDTDGTAHTTTVILGSSPVA